MTGGRIIAAFGTTGGGPWQTLALPTYLYLRMIPVYGITNLSVFPDEKNDEHAVAEAIKRVDEPYLRTHPPRVPMHRSMAVMNL